jgi:hypothetical protein
MRSLPTRLRVEYTSFVTGGTYAKNGGSSRKLQRFGTHQKYFNVDEFKSVTRHKAVLWSVLNMEGSNL